ncbi:hypothetical protein ACVGWN_19355, partial [Enterobacter hormaechei]
CRPGKRSATGQKRAERAEGRPPGQYHRALVKKIKKGKRVCGFFFFLVSCRSLWMALKKTAKESRQNILL